MAEKKEKKSAGTRKRTAKASVVDEKKPEQSRRGVFKVSMTAVYNDDGIDMEAIADSVGNAMMKVGNGLIVVHVDSVRKVSDGDKELARILGEMSEQSQDAMSHGSTDDGRQYVSVKKTK